MSNQWNSLEKRIQSLEQWQSAHISYHSHFELRKPAETKVDVKEVADEWRRNAVDLCEMLQMGRRISPLEAWMELGKRIKIAEEPRLAVRAPSPSPSRAGSPLHHFIEGAFQNCTRCGMPRGAWQHTPA